MFPDLSLICTDLLLRFVNRCCWGGALGTSAALFTVCVHTVSSPCYEGGIGLSTSLFRRCSFTPHPPIRLRTPRRPPENASSEVRAFSFGPGLDCVVARSDGSRAVTTTIAQLCHRCELSHQSYGMPALAGITSCNFGLHYVLAAARRQPCTHTIGSACR